MGVSVLYCAIPPASSSYARLQQQRPLAILAAAAFPYGCGLFHFPDIEADERREILEDAVRRYRAALGPEPEARRWVEEFLSELMHTRAAFPGIEDRATMLEKIADVVEECLVAGLAGSRGPYAGPFVRRLMFGDEVLAGPLLREGDPSLGLVSPALVAEAARVLRALDVKAAFSQGRGPEVLEPEDFPRWRQLYLDAAEHDEAILVGVS